MRKRTPLTAAVLIAAAGLVAGPAVADSSFTTVTPWGADVKPVETAFYTVPTIPDPGATEPTASPSGSPATTAPTTTAAPTPTKTSTPTPTKTTTSAPTPTKTTSPTPTPTPKPTDTRPKCTVPSGADAKKVIVVNGTGGADAKLSACVKTSSGYRTEIAASSHVGYNGIAKAGAKREGDGKTPSGVYSLDEGFGVKAKPSQFTAGSYDKVTKDDVWVDGSATKAGGYNTHQKKSKGYSGESMYQTPAYDYAQVIGYNKARTAGKGSAIFLHVNTGSGKTAGCVSVEKSVLLDLFKWEGNTDTQIAITQ